MGLFSFSDQELADKAVEAARVAWGEGRRLFVHKLSMGIGSKNDPGTLLTLPINGIADLGWELHSLTPYINSIGPNSEVVLLTFERPRRADAIARGAADG